MSSNLKNPNPRMHSLAIGLVLGLSVWLGFPPLHHYQRSSSAQSQGAWCETLPLGSSARALSFHPFNQHLYSIPLLDVAVAGIDKKAFVQRILAYIQRDCAMGLHSTPTKRPRRSRTPAVHPFGHRSAAAWSYDLCLFLSPTD